MRAEKTPDGGMKGVYVSLSDTTSDMENLAGYDVTIDPQGKIVSATQEQRGRRLYARCFPLAAQAGSPNALPVLAAVCGGGPAESPQ